MAQNAAVAADGAFYALGCDLARLILCQHLRQPQLDAAYRGVTQAAVCRPHPHAHKFHALFQWLDAGLMVQSKIQFPAQECGDLVPDVCKFLLVAPDDDMKSSTILSHPQRVEPILFM